VCIGANARSDYPWSSTGLFLGLTQAWVVSMNLARAAPPAFVPNRMGSDSAGSAGRRMVSRASLNSGHCVMMCTAVWSGVWPHWQPWGLEARGQCLALYSPVKACSVSSLMAVQKTGRAKLSIPEMNSGACPEGGWWSAWYAGLRRGLASHIFSQSWRTLSLATCLSAAMVGGAWGSDELAFAATLVAMSRMHFKGAKLAEPGIQLMETVLVVCGCHP
jgi:hypothetical protein